MSGMLPISTAAIQVALRLRTKLINQYFVKTGRRAKRSASAAGVTAALAEAGDSSRRQTDSPSHATRFL
jgi:hypothetical protein